MREIALGLVGLGAHGARYASHLLRGDIRNARLASVCRRNRAQGESFAKAHGISFYQDYRTLVSAPEVDAVAVVTPVGSHLSVCRAALEAGKPVLVEKPVVDYLDRGADLAAAVASSSAPLMVAQTLRYNAVVSSIRRLRGLVGRPIRFRMAMRRPPDGPKGEPRGGTPRGCLLEIGVHLIDALRWIFEDEPAQVFCVTGALMGREIEDFFSAELTLAGSGIRCNLEVSKLTRARSEPVDLTGDRGQLSGDARIGELILTDETERRRLDPGRSVQTVSAVLNDFVSCVIEGAPMPIPLGEGLRAVQIVEACYASAREGRFVQVPEALSEGLEKGRI